MSMAGRKAIKTTKEEIVNYWAGHSSFLIIFQESAELPHLLLN